MDIRRACIFSDELPFWLKIGPICWRATYRKGWVWLPRMMQVDHDMYKNHVTVERVRESNFVEYRVS